MEAQEGWSNNPYLKHLQFLRRPKKNKYQGEREVSIRWGLVVLLFLLLYTHESKHREAKNRGEII
jgi:hypothetical protein